MEPPRPIRKFYYWCDKKFLVDPLEELYVVEKRRIGILQVFGEETVVMISDGYENTVLDVKTTKLQKRQDRGGQSQNRIARLRLETIHNYLKSASEKAVAAFVKAGKSTIDGLLVIGPGMKKEQIIDYLGTELTSKLVRVVTADKFDISEKTKTQVNDMLDTLDDKKENTDLKTISTLLETDIDLLVFGESEINADRLNIKHVYDSESVKRRYGGPVGVRYYAQKAVIEEMTDNAEGTVEDNLEENTSDVDGIFD